MADVGLQTSVSLEQVQPGGSTVIGVEEQEEAAPPVMGQSAPAGSGPQSPHLRARSHRRAHSDQPWTMFPFSTPEGFVAVNKPPSWAENEIEALKIANNYRFGFKKWKSHVTARPLEVRSDVVKELYSEPRTVKLIKGSTISPGNVLYSVLFGWWIAAFYFLVAGLMMLTYIGRVYGSHCFKLAKYFFWPFGKFVQKDRDGDSGEEQSLHNGSVHNSYESFESSESTPLVSSTRSRNGRKGCCGTSTEYWHKPETYIWLILGAPLLFVIHALVYFVCWILVVFIPVAKVNGHAIKMLLMPPGSIRIESDSMSAAQQPSEVIVCTYQAVNVYYYKYTIDGMNIVLVNLLLFVVMALIAGYGDKGNQYTSPTAKFVISLLAIIPLAYYIGLAIASIAAQSNFAVGAVLNASFGSVVELTLYITALVKGAAQANNCYSELVKSALTGTLLGTMLFIPGLCMIIGGLKHHEQFFNLRSAGVSSTLLFVSVAGAFAPTIFSKFYGSIVCSSCNNVTSWSNINDSLLTETGPSGTFMCSDCHQEVFDQEGTLFNEHIKPLIYTCAVLLPLAYISGLLFTLKTHSHIYDEEKTEDNNTAPNQDHNNSHSTIAHWSRLKGVTILLVATVLMSLCADLVTENMQPILTGSGVSQYFIGVTLLALVPDTPEIVNGIQFALQNNLSLSIEVGSSIAVQVCLLQMPILVLVNAIHEIGFQLLFIDLHLWSVLFSVLVMNYIFMDGKCDYFQGSAMCIVYLIIVAMYFFAPNPEGC
ncbi:Hypp7776 [Branchiostoma lanceolatum]|nr:Hypp7776 [Branchiostoma lanceolatum]